MHFDNFPKLDQPAFVLDLGCGSGLSGECLEENGHYWVGVDISPAMLKIAQEREVEGDLLLGDLVNQDSFKLCFLASFWC
jgi:18S rRNA (guanine1575-N7)-methyltransferase